MKKAIALILLLLSLTFILTACSGNNQEKVTCTICNGSGQVKYYFGDGDNDYNMGPCTSCDEKGFILVTPSGDSDGEKKIICGSCEKYVDEVITKDDAAGESRTWCSDCWASYDIIMGR